jgi:hypothetical protein
MIVAASTTLLADSRSGQRGGVLPWVLLAIGSVASLAANVAVAEPSITGRVIAAWPSFALIGSYELLMRQVRRSTSGAQPGAAAQTRPERRSEPAIQTSSESKRADLVAGRDMRKQAWEWAVANKGVDGFLPSGKSIGDQFGRHERWGRLVKTAGVAGEFTAAASR